MNVDEAMRQFAERSVFPREALQWALDNWDEASPRLIAKLRAHAAGASDVDVDVLFHVVHLCGEKCDARAYAPLCEIIASDETFDAWFGDAVGDSLTGILINLCDGDVEPLQRLIESPEADEVDRVHAMEALTFLVRAKHVLSDEEMRAYLARLAAEMQPRGESLVWMGWVTAVAQLGYETMRAEVGRVFSRKWIAPSDLTLEDFYEDLRTARSDPDGMAAMTAWGIAPFESTIEALERFSYAADEEEFDADEPGRIGDSGEYSLEKPFVNPFRDVGRNEPCPCGSGKKYKKCCLAA